MGTLTESLSQVMDLRPGMRVLDIGCGKALSSIFLAKEFGVQVWAVDPLVAPAENADRVEEAGVSDLVFPLRADARSLPFPKRFFDAAISINAYWIFGTDDFYLPRYFADVVKQGARIGLISPGLKREFDGEVPAHVKPFWLQHVIAYHSVEWWKQHFLRTGLVNILVADNLGGDEGVQVWRTWAGIMNPGKDTLIEADNGENITFTRLVLQRNAVSVS